VKNRSIDKKETPIDINEFENGVYFITITQGNQTINKKIILQK